MIYAQIACPDCDKTRQVRIIKGKPECMLCHACANKRHRIKPRINLGEPKLGEIRRSFEIGGNDGNRQYIWQSCKICNRPSWFFILNTTTMELRTEHCKSCGIKVRVIKTHNTKLAKAGRFTGKDGYVYVRIEANDSHFEMGQGNNLIYRWLPEHRLVMAQYLGKCLEPQEVVHHKNGDKTDNKLENLELTKRGEHLTKFNGGYREGFEAGYKAGYEAGFISFGG